MVRPGCSRRCSPGAIAGNPVGGSGFRGVSYAASYARRVRDTTRRVTPGDPDGRSAAGASTERPASGTSTKAATTSWSARAPMTCTLGSDEVGRSTLRHLTFASYRSPESATALFTSRCLWLRRASVGAGAHPSVVARRGRAPGHSAHSGPPLTPAKQCPLRHGMSRRQHCSPFSCSRWCYRSPRRRSSCRPAASLSHSSCRAAHPLTCR